MKKLILLLLIVSLGFNVIAISSEEIKVIVTEAKQVENFNAKGITAAPFQDLKELDKEYEYTSFNGFSAKVTKEEFQELKNNPYYNVREARVYHTSLDLSGPYIGSDSVFNLTLDGKIIDGTGQTVCIIDTGVNYSHSAFGGCYGNNDNTSNCTVIGGYDFVNGDSDPMDDNGHGTHVAGIVASTNETYKGVSPGSKIIMIKALDNGGSGFDTDIISGIDWCVNNASKFNISVISMSLSDCTNWSVFCDADSSYNDSWTPAVDAAAAANITVTAAAGNGNGGSCSGTPGLTSLDGPSGPACLSNVTAIGAVRDTDSAFFYQRGSLFQMQAPGVSICSTRYSTYGTGCGDGTFAITGGTSMAAPHFAGTVALIQQISLSQDNRSRTSNEINNLFNITGDRINDSGGTGLNFSRIDVYNASLYIDVTAPNFSISGPINGSTQAERNFNFTCNVSDWQLSNLTFKLWNSSGILYSNQTINVSGLENTSTFEITSLPKDEWVWNCESNDEKSNFNVSSNYTVTNVDVLMNLISPLNNTNITTANTNFSCNITSDFAEISNITLYIWNSSGSLEYNETVSLTNTTNSTTINYTLINDTDYIWNCLGINNESNSSFASLNYSFKFDGTAPSILNISDSAGVDSVTITWVTSELANQSIGGDLSGTNASFNLNHSITIGSLNDATEYDYTITSCDPIGNCATSSSRSITTDDDTTTSGGGGGTTIVTQTVEVITIGLVDSFEGVARKMSKGDKIEIELNSGSHTITLENITNETGNFSIESELFYLDLGVGKDEKLNLSSPDYLDLLLRIENISSDYLYLFIQRMYEETNSTEVVENLNETEIVEEILYERSLKRNEAIALALGIVVVLFIVYKLFIEKKKLKGKKTSKLRGKKTSKKHEKGKKKKASAKTKRKR